MKAMLLRFVLAAGVLSATHSRGAILYVDLNSPGPTTPFTSWATAATSIQSAIDVAASGDQILVKDGIYNSGSKNLNGPNRVGVNKAVALQSVNGPAVTIIDGLQTMRCVYLASGASLTGFTLTNGTSSPSGGGAFCESTNVVISNCVFARNLTYGDGGGTYSGTLNNCTLDYNGVDWGSTGSGGGAMAAVLNNCTLTNNRASLFGHGGGAHSSTLNNCLLTGNGSFSGGGGATSCVLSNCTLSGNTILFLGSGGGAESSMLFNCVLTGNSGSYGGGAASSILNNCSLSGNVTWSSGGGALSSTLSNCTLIANSAPNGGGAADSTLYNCIAFYNIADTQPNYANCTLNFCCTTPLPASGTNNITTEPQLTDLSHIAGSSPCLGAGNNTFAAGTDIDGETWNNPPAIGCDEYHAGNATGPLSVVIQTTFTNIAADFSLDFTGLVTGHATVNVWNFGDGTTISNRLFVAHSWTSPGDYPVVFTAYNDSNPGGVSATVTVHIASQSVFYVAQTSPTPTAPYASWATAATNIQDAVDVAVTGATVLVSNGVYRTGGRPVYNLSLTNRVAVIRPMTVRSVNGPAFTTIEGHQAAPLALGYDSVRCVYLTNQAALFGFTVTNGATQPGNDQDGRETIGGGVWCESKSASVSNCVITSCVAYSGGGIMRGTVRDTVLTNNAANYQGGGAAQGLFDRCTFENNFTFLNGYSTGGGVDSSTLNNCILKGNRSDYAGGAMSSTLNNCALYSNSAGTAGGAAGCTLNNCTLAGNSAITAGGVESCTLNNSIVYYNTAATNPNHSSSTLNFSCTTPLPDTGTNNTTTDPQLASPSHLSSGSPCRNAGSIGFVSGVDIDGEAWADPPSMGCDEFNAAASGPLSAGVSADYTNAVIGFVINVSAEVIGNATVSFWNFGDGTIVSNQPFASHAWAAAGDYPVVLRAYNASNPGGVTATQIVHVVEGIYYVALTSTNPVAPYNSWNTAATNIQDAIDVALLTGTVLVSNGVYQAGGRVMHGSMTNRVVINKTVSVRSVNGPAVTVIEGRKVPVTVLGDSAVRCVYMTNGTFLSGFTLANGATRHDGDYETEEYGGGLWCESSSAVISNCVVTGNAAVSAGGVYRGTLNNCVVTGNSAGDAGGGAFVSELNSCLVTSNSAGSYGGGGYGTFRNCTLSHNLASRSAGANGYLFNCTVVSNTATSKGGGVEESELRNCIVYYNSAPSGPDAYVSALSFCCTPAGGFGGITNEPLFMNLAGGDFRLQSSSPCINSGKNSDAPTGPDFDGNARIVGGTVDIGAYEYQSPSSVLSYAWAQQNGLPTDGSADFTDTDSDGASNWQEWRADTIPTNAVSTLHMLTATNNPAGVEVSWQSVDTRSYWLERAINLGAVAPFQSIATNIAGAPGLTTFTDTDATNAGPYFYRVGVQ